MVVHRNSCWGFHPFYQWFCLSLFWLGIHYLKYHKNYFTVFEKKISLFFWTKYLQWHGWHHKFHIFNTSDRRECQLSAIWYCNTIKRNLIKSMHNTFIDFYQKRKYFEMSERAHRRIFWKFTDNLLMHYHINFIFFLAVAFKKPGSLTHKIPYITLKLYVKSLWHNFFLYSSQFHIHGKSVATLVHFIC